MKPLRLTNHSISKHLGFRIDRLKLREFTKPITEIEGDLTKQLEPLLAPVQSKLDEVNGRARSRTINHARELFDLAIGIEIELRVRGVSIKNIKGTKVHFVPKCGFKNTTTSVSLERYSTGWFATRIERASTYNGKHVVHITPDAAADIVAAKIRIGPIFERFSVSVS
jgi:hypothetical protein